MRAVPRGGAGAPLGQSVVLAPSAADPAILDRQDELVARRLRSSQAIDRYMTLTHRRPRDENLLWLADSVAWAVRRHIAAELSAYAVEGG